MPGLLQVVCEIHGREFINLSLWQREEFTRALWEKNLRALLTQQNYTTIGRTKFKFKGQKPTINTERYHLPC